jgi:hypothetical protein
MHFYDRDMPPTPEEIEAWTIDDELPSDAPPGALELRNAVLRYGYMDVFPRLAATPLELSNMGMGARRYMPSCMNNAVLCYAIGEEWNAEGLFC